MSVGFYRESPGKFDSRTLNRTTLSMWTGRDSGGPYLGRETGRTARSAVSPANIYTYIYIYIYIYTYISS